VIAMQRVREFMTRDVISARPETPLKDVARLLVDERISGVPVVDEHGAVVGVVSEADFVAKERGVDDVRHRRFSWLLGDSAETKTQLAKLTAESAGEAMTAPAITIDAGRPINEAASLMARCGLNRLPVVDDGRLVGIVTRADLVRAFVRSDEELARTIREDVILGILWLDPAPFEVDVRAGVVTIGGRVERRSTVESLERATRMVPGVVDVRVDVTWAVDDSDLAPVTYDPAFPFGPQ
jgi:CBS domain-containing protein